MAKQATSHWSPMVALIQVKLSTLPTIPLTTIGTFRTTLPGLWLGLPIPLSLALHLQYPLLYRHLTKVALEAVAVSTYPTTRAVAAPEVQMMSLARLWYTRPNIHTRARMVHLARVGLLEAVVLEFCQLALLEQSHRHRLPITLDMCIRPYTVPTKSSTLR